MQRHLPIAEAKARFAECIRRAETGEMIVLTRHGRPVARLAGLRAGTTSPVLRDRSEDEVEHAVEVRESGTSYGTAQRLRQAPEGRREALERLLEKEIWPRVPPELLDRGMSKREREQILGLGEGGV